MSWCVTAVGPMGNSVSEASAAVKSDIVVMLMDGDCVTGDAGTVSVSRMVTDSTARGWRDSRSVFGSPRSVAIGVVPRPPWSLAAANFGPSIVSADGRGRPSHPRSRSSRSSCSSRSSWSPLLTQCCISSHGARTCSSLLFTDFRL